MPAYRNLITIHAGAIQRLPILNVAHRDRNWDRPKTQAAMRSRSLRYARPRKLTKGCSPGSAGRRHGPPCGGGPVFDEYVGLNWTSFTRESRSVHMDSFFDENDRVR